MQEAIRKARVLIEALSWIQRFKGRYVVVKLGGSTLDQPEAVESLLTDIVFMASVGMRPIVVHGGGKAISAAMAEAGIEPRFVEGRRYTDPDTLKIASRVLVESISARIVATLQEKGATATPVHFQTENALVAEKLELIAAD